MGGPRRGRAPMMARGPRGLGYGGVWRDAAISGAFVAGARAWRAGRPLEASPYRAGSDEGRAWANGWQYAMDRALDEAALHPR